MSPRTATQKAITVALASCISLSASAGTGTGAASGQKAPAPQPGELTAGAASSPLGQVGQGLFGGHETAAQPIHVPLIVQEARPPHALDMDRIGEFVSVGIPFAQGEVQEVDGRPAIRVAQSPVYQAETLASWPDGSVKWALVTFQADLVDGQQVGQPVLRPGSGRSAGHDVAHAAPKHVKVDTGPLRFLLTTFGGNLTMKGVWVDGGVLALSAGQSLIQGTAADGSPLSVLPDVELVVERNGPAQTVIRARGTLSEDGLSGHVDFTLRLTAHAGRRDVKAELTLHNADHGPAHRDIGGVSVVLPANLGTQLDARLSAVDAANQPIELALDVPAGSDVSLQIRKTTALTVGDTTWLPPGVPGLGVAPLFDSPSPWVEKEVSWIENGELKTASKRVYTEAGYRVAVGGVAVPGHDFVHTEEQLPDRYPQRPAVSLTSPRGGVIASVQNWVSMWPAQVAADGAGRLHLDLFPYMEDEVYTLNWQQDETRIASFAFYGSGESPAGKLAQASHRLDAPLAARAADYLHYDRAGVFPYRLVSVEEQAEVHGLMGLPQQFENMISNPHYEVTRYFYAHTTGGFNNYARAEDWFVGHWLRSGRTGAYLRALDRCNYIADWAVKHSDGAEYFEYHDSQAQPEGGTSKHAFDWEHRYLDGIIAGYHLTGDARYLRAIEDEAERMVHLDPHHEYGYERGMYQLIRAMARACEVVDDPALKQSLEEKVERLIGQQYDCFDGLECPGDTWGWNDEPGLAAEPFIGFINAMPHSKLTQEMIDAGVIVDGAEANTAGGDELHPESVVCRGFVSASLGPLALYHASRVIDPQLAQAARRRARDMGRFTYNDLWGVDEDGDAQIAYVLQVTNDVVLEGDWEDYPHHPISLGLMAAAEQEPWNAMAYYEQAQVQLQSAHDQGLLANFLTRPDCQHFLRLYIDMLD